MEIKFFERSTAKDPHRDYLWVCSGCHKVGTFESFTWTPFLDDNLYPAAYIRQHECGGFIDPLVPRHRREGKVVSKAPSALYKKDFDKLSPTEQQERLKKIQNELIEHDRQWNEYYQANKEMLMAEHERNRLAMLTAEANKPRCPHCQSQSIKKISMFNRSLSVGLFGLASDKIGKQFQCESCGYKW